MARRISARLREQLRNYLARSLFSRSRVQPNYRSRKRTSHQLQRQLLTLSRRAGRTTRDPTARLRKSAAANRKDRRVHSQEPRRTKNKAGEIPSHDAAETGARRRGTLQSG